METDANINRKCGSNLSILANSPLLKEPVPPMSFMENKRLDFSSGDPGETQEIII